MIPSFIKWFTPSFCSQCAYTQIGDETKHKNWGYRIKLGPKDGVCDF